MQPLERRVMMSAAVADVELPSACTCPYCAAPLGVLEEPSRSDGGGGDGDLSASSGPTFPLSAMPAFHSRPGARANLYVQFTGQAAMTWSGGINVPETPAFTLDGDATTFTAAELAAINEILLRVAEKYSPFNINVTNVDPGNLNKRETAKIIVGGTGSWLGYAAGGVAFIGGFYNSSSSIGWAFSALFGGNIKSIAEVVAHEAGHLFGLQHQSNWSGSTRIQEYNSGNSLRAPVMGNSYSSARGLWWYGPTPTSAAAIQDDLWRLSGSLNGFGYRADDHGNTLETATSLTVVNGTAVAAGVIEQTTDIDTFSFTVTTPGQVTVSGAVAPFGAMLDMSLELYDSSGTLVASAATPSLGETITTNLPAGAYYVMVRSAGEYGDIGQYTLTVSVPQGQPPAPPVAAVSGPYAVAEGGTVLLSAAASTGTGLTFEWDLDGDGVFGETGGSATRGNETGVSVTFNATGLDGPSVFNVTLRVTDSAGQVSTLLVPISVTDVAPTVTLGGAIGGFEGTPITITFTATDPGGANDPITSWLVNWGDGTTSTYGGSVTSATKTYLDDGNYVVTLTAINKDASSTVTRSLAIANVAPTLTLQTSVPGGGPPREGSPVQISFTATDPGTDTVNQWIVEWGDGTTSTYAGTVSTATKTFADNGTYTLRLTAVDEDGSYTTTTALVVENVAPTVTLTGSPNPKEGSPFTLSWTAFDPGADTISQWVVEWGDGTTSTYAGTVSSAVKTYADDGNYTIRVTATDEDGNWVQTMPVSVANVAPVLTLTGSPNPKEGSPFTLSWTAFDPGADTISQWVVEWGDGTTSTYAGTVSSAVKTYADDGAYVIRVTATDEDGSYQKTLDLVVANVIPVITWNAPAEVVAGAVYTVTFSASDPGADTIGSWRVEWGDGTSTLLPGTATSASRIFATPGSYTVTLRATDEDGTYSVSRPVTVSTAPVAVSLSGSAFPVEGSPFTLHFSASSAVPITVSSWTVTWGDGTTSSYAGSVSSAVKTYADDGQYLVRVTAMVGGQSYQGELEVSVANVAPTITLTASPSPVEGSPMTLSWSATDPGTDTISQWRVEWGDGTTSTFAGTVSSAVKTYADNGSYTIRVTATDEDGQWVQTLPLTVANVAPSLALSASATRQEGTPITFNWSATDPGADTVTQWRLEWGDGTTSTFAGTVTTAVKTYADNGNYTVRLTATDEDGSYVHTMNLSVANVAPTITLTASPSPVEGSPMTLSWSATDPGADTISQWRVEWGDGTTSTFAGTVSTATKTYADNGNYMIRVTATDDDGQWVRTLPVSVANVAPTITLTLPEQVREAVPFTLGFTATDPGADTIVLWRVEWGDGTTTTYSGMTASAVKTYADDGNYALRVTAIDEDGQWTVTRQVAVAVVPPTVSLFAPASVRAGEACVISFSAANTGNDPVLGWIIDWGNGETVSLPATASTLSRVWDTSGDRVVRVAAVDSDGTWWSGPATVSVTAAPAATLSLQAPTQTVSGWRFNVRFDLNSAGSRTLGQWGYSWDGGATWTALPSPASPSTGWTLTAPAPGNRVLAVRATLSDGSQVTATSAVRVLSGAELVSVTVPELAVAGAMTVVHFDASGPAAEGRTAWRIVWSDGVEQVLPATARAAMRALPTEGEFVVQAISVHADGEAASAGAAVRSEQPTITVIPPRTVLAGEEAIFTIEVNPDVASLVRGWTISGADGQTQQLPPEARTFARMFASAGNASLTVTAVFDHGHTAEWVGGVRVSPAPQIVSGSWAQLSRGLAALVVTVESVPADAGFAVRLPSGEVWQARLVSSDGSTLTLQTESPHGVIDARDSGPWTVLANWDGHDRTLGSVLADTGAGTFNLHTVSGSLVLPRPTTGLPSGVLLPGATLRATARVTADGTGVIIATDVGFYLSQDTVWGPGDAALATTNIRGRFVPGQVKNAAARLVLPAGIAPGTYHILAVADASEALTEPDERDNVRSLGTVTVVAPTVDLTGSRFLQVQTNRSGQVSAVRLLLTNDGNTAARDVVVRVMLLDGEGGLSESPVAEAALGRATLSSGAQRALRLVPRGTVVPPGVTLVAVVSAQGQSPFATAPVSLAA